MQNEALSPSEFVGRLKKHNTQSINVTQFSEDNSQTFKEASATLKYRVGNIIDSIIVGAKANSYRSREDWIIQLGIDAAINISKKHNTDLGAALISIDSISLSEPK